jgi:hypothetical protein
MSYLSGLTVKNSAGVRTTTDSSFYIYRQNWSPTYSSVDVGNPPINLFSKGQKSGIYYTYPLTAEHYNNGNDLLVRYESASYGGEYSYVAPKDGIYYFSAQLKVTRGVNTGSSNKFQLLMRLENATKLRTELYSILTYPGGTEVDSNNPPNYVTNYHKLSLHLYGFVQLDEDDIVLIQDDHTAAGDNDYSIIDGIGNTFFSGALIHDL